MDGHCFRGVDLKILFFLLSRKIDSLRNHNHVRKNLFYNFDCFFGQGHHTNYEYKLDFLENGASY